MIYIWHAWKSKIDNGCLNMVNRRNKLAWIYLGENYIKMMNIERSIGQYGERKCISNLLQETASELRESYIDFIGRLGQRNNSLYWWATSISEKNPYISKLFLYCCYLKVFERLIENHFRQELLVIVERQSLKDAIIRLAASKNVKIVDLSKRYVAWFESLNCILRIILSRVEFILLSVYRHLVTRSTIRRKYHRDQDDIVFIPWIDERSFHENSSYHDTYFGDLINVFKKKGLSICFFPHILPTISYNKALKSINRSGETFYIPFEYVSIIDVLRSAFYTLFKCRVLINNERFAGMNVSKLIRDEMMIHLGTRRICNTLLYYYAVKRLCSRQHIKMIIYTFENHVWEKMLCSAVRQCSSSTRLIGYQGYAIPSLMQLVYYPSKYEQSIMPFPHRIVTCNETVKEIWSQYGYPKENDFFLVGPSVRYQYLRELISEENCCNFEEAPDGIHRLLLATTIEKTRSLEMIIKVVSAFRNKDGYEILIKPHPCMPITADLIEELMGITLPSNVHFTNQAISELLKGVDLLFYSDSLTAYEALAHGVPAVHIQSDLDISLDSLDWIPECRWTAGNEEQIYSATESIFDLPVTAKNNYKNMWIDVVRRVFSTFELDASNVFLWTRH